MTRTFFPRVVVSMEVKRVTFNEKDTVHETYSNYEYDRSITQGILYKKSFNRISSCVWQKIMQDLELYKSREMAVHIDTI